MGNRWTGLAILFVTLLFYTMPLTAQEEQNQGGQIQSEDTTRNAQLARSNPDYLVTAGDIYTLAYTANGVAITYRITVDSSYRIRISNLGVLNAAGRTFRQLKTDAETIVSNNYPLSGVQLVLNQPGIFRVFVNGEVQAATEVSTWALARLSSLTGHMTAYASFRNVTVTSGNGQVKTYDLFKAERLGDLSQNPYLRPDDVITFNRFDRRVTINGSVERPGVYQLLTGEHLKDLIETYANGFTPLADKTRMKLIRYIGSGSISGDRMLLKETDIGGNYILRNYDVVTIPSITETRPVATVDRLERKITLVGAVRRPGTYDLLPNENLRDLIEIYGDGFIPLADKTRIELVRYVGGGSISGDKLLLKESDVNANYRLEHFDKVTIPDIRELRPVATVDRLERRITLEGAVRRPGTYELLPHENLRDLIEVYGDSFTPLADTTRMELIRYVGGGSVSGDKIIFTEEDIKNNYPLENYDRIVIPDITSQRPVATIDRIERLITLDGAVRRPGTYNMLPGEHLRDLIEVYGDGLSPLADPTRMEVIRYVNSDSPSGDKIRIEETAIADNFLLENYDTVFVPSIVQLRPVFFIEGAIKNTNENVSGPSSSFREVVNFNKGETYSAVVRRNTRWFTEESDTQNAYIERSAERIPINLNRILYDVNFRNEMLIEENDVLIVPFRQYFITVAGAVMIPGRYPYIPDRNWEYYVSLAGGFIPDRNLSGSIKIQDMDGKILKKTDIISPETTITARTNHWLYYFNQLAPIITTLLSIATTVISVSLIAR
jgi:protein involved in polysaccharide export with SLBB domain